MEAGHAFFFFLDVLSWRWAGHLSAPIEKTKVREEEKHRATIRMGLVQEEIETHPSHIYPPPAPTINSNLHHLYRVFVTCVPLSAGAAASGAARERYMPFKK